MTSFIILAVWLIVAAVSFRKILRVCVNVDDGLMPGMALFVSILLSLLGWPLWWSFRWIYMAAQSNRLLETDSQRIMRLKHEARAARIEHAEALRTIEAFDRKHGGKS